MMPNEYVTVVRRAMSALLIVAATSACAQTATKPTGASAATYDNERAPFQVTFTADGKPIVLAPDGKTPLKPIRVQLPKGASAILQQYSFNAVEVKGSHYLLLCFPGAGCVCYDLPHPPSGATGNSCTTR